MTERERLIELLQNARQKNLNLLSFEIDILADYLLANGVIVPPCKLCDVVYIKNKRGDIISMETCAIHSGISPKGKSVNYVCYRGANSEKTYSGRVRFYDFDKTVFLTHEEAEAALEKYKSGCD